VTEPGYRPTARVFNASPTYELAAAGSPVAPPERLPEVVDLLQMVATMTPGMAASLALHIPR